VVKDGLANAVTTPLGFHIIVLYISSGIINSKIRLMTRNEISSNGLKFIEDYVEMVEKVLENGWCWTIREVWNKDDFTKDELEEAYRKQRNEINSVIFDLTAVQNETE
jgi:hypothetical protein